MTELQLETTIVDLPTTREHAFATSTLRQRSLVIVQLRSEGLIGIGEGVVPGPWWAGESAETMKLVIDKLLAPSLSELSALAPRAGLAAMHRAVSGNHFAKAAVEMALWDLTGKRFGCSIADLLGGACRTDIPITWSISAAVEDDCTSALAEAEQRAGEGFGAFKFKMGALAVDDDIAYVTQVREKLADVATIVVDPNGAWDEPTALRALRELAANGVRIAEQPVPRWNVSALARLRQSLDMIVMADESAQSSHDMADLLRRDAVTAVSVKLPKAAGLLQAAAMADIAIAGGIAVYGGTTMESSIGAAASAQLYSVWPTLLGCELVGPLLLREEVVTEPICYRAGRLQVPSGPGLGIDLDDDKLRFYARADV